MRCLLTGGNGFLGSHLVDVLLEQKVDLTVLVRPTSDLRWLQGKKVTVETVPLTDVELLRKAVTGCDVVFHVAGLTRGSSRQAYMEVNVDTTRCMVDACASAGGKPPRFVFVSSLAACGPSEPGRPRDESWPARPVGVYGESKAAAEELLKRRSSDLEWVILQPGPIYGPRDKDMLMVLQWAARGLRLVPGLFCELNFAHVSDVARALFLAATRPGAPFNSFLIGGPRNVKGIEAANAFGRAVKTMGVVVPMPGPVVWAAAACFELASRFTGVESIMSFDKAREITTGSWALDISKARRILEYRPSWDLEPGLRQTVDWYKKEGWM